MMAQDLVARTTAVKLAVFEGVDFRELVNPPPLIPRNELIAFEVELNQALQPASRRDAQVVVAMIVGCYRKTEVQDPDVYITALVDELLKYPNTILRELVHEVRTTCKWLPRIAEIVEIANHLMFPHWQRQQLVQKLLLEHDRRDREQQAQDEAARRKAEKHSATISRLREIFPGATVPDDLDLEGAHLGLPCLTWKSFDEALYRGERWALDAIPWLAIVGRAPCSGRSPEAMVELVKVASTDLTAGRILAASLQTISLQEGKGSSSFDERTMKAINRAVLAALPPFRSRP